MKRTVLILVLLAAAGTAGYFAWRYAHPKTDAKELALHGNVDLRQVELAFNTSERIVAVLVQEGDRVKKGQVLARADTSRIEPQIEQAEAIAAAERAIVERLHNGSRVEEIAEAKAQTAAMRASVDRLHAGSRVEEIAQAKANVAAQQHVVERLRNGSRPEEISQARANVESAIADAKNAKIQYERLDALVKSPAGKAVSQQDVDNAKAALDMADSRLAVNRKTLELALLSTTQRGCRRERRETCAQQSRARSGCRRAAQRRHRRSGSEARGHASRAGHDRHRPA